MRMIDLTNIPKKEGFGVNKGKMLNCWKESVGKKCDFVYDDIEGTVTIVGYDIKTRRISINYNDVVTDISVDRFMECKLSKVLGLTTINHRFKIGDIVKNIKILDTIYIEKKNNKKERGYLLECLNDGYIYKNFEYGLINSNGCPVCSNKKIIKGINDIGTIRPDLIKYFVNKEDAYRLSVSSNRKIKLMCPNCGSIKMMTINKLSSRGICCIECRDRIPIGEKVMMSILKTMNVTYEREKAFEWSCNRRYDFYIKDINCIIEMHGRQHYEDSCFEYMSGGRTLEHEKLNDLFKKDIALKNGIEKYFEIDCSSGDINRIFKSIMNTELYFVLKLEQLNKSIFYENFQDSLMIKICNYWNSMEYKCTSDVMNEFCIGREAVIRYLRNGQYLGICDYDSNKIIGGKVGRKTIEIKVLELDMVFSSYPNLIKYFSEKMSINMDRNSIRKAIKKGRKYKGYTFIIVDYD